MEPKLPTPNFQPERSPLPQEQTGERSPEPFAETLRENTSEVERRSSQVTPAPVLPPVSLPLPPAPNSIPPEPGVASLADTPLVAADEDLIEKEWVDKAKKIVEATKDDP